MVARAIITAFALLTGLSAVSAQPAVASFYNCLQPGECSRHKITANGEKFRRWGRTAAHRTLPFGTRVRVCAVEKRAKQQSPKFAAKSQRCVIVRINDRGPVPRHVAIDLAEGAARAIGMTGNAPVVLKVLR